MQTLLLLGALREAGQVVCHLMEMAKRLLVPKPNLPPGSPAPGLADQ